MRLIIRVGHYVGFWLRRVEVSFLSHQTSFALLSGLSYSMLIILCYNYLFATFCWLVYHSNAAHSVDCPHMAE